MSGYINYNEHLTKRMSLLYEHEGNTVESKNVESGDSNAQHSSKFIKSEHETLN